MVSNLSGSIKDAGCDCKASALKRCAHISALLLHLSDTVSQNKMIIPPSTSEECSWNKDRKRQKNPRKLHKAVYEFSKRKPRADFYEYDPRPEQLRSVSTERVNDFVVRLQSDSNKVCGNHFYESNTKIGSLIKLID